MELRARLGKVTAQDLNTRMIRLESLRTAGENVAKLLEDSRRGIRMITPQAGTALPGGSAPGRNVVAR